MKTNNTERNRRILVVDEDRSVHDRLRSIIAEQPDRGATDGQSAESGNGRGVPHTPTLNGQFQIDSAYQGEEALLRIQQALVQCRPYALAFIDAHISQGWDGIETTSRLWRLDPHLQVILCTSDRPLPLDRVFGQLGESDRLLMLRKPFDGVQVRLLTISMIEKWNAISSARAEIRTLEKWVVDAERVLKVLQESHDALERAHVATQGRASELARLLQQRTVESVVTRDVTVLALAKLAESRDPETGEHLERMRSYSQILADYLSREGPYTDQIDEAFLEELYRSSPLHDIGKVGIPDEILLKPGPLTPEEFEVMKRHAEIGADALKEVAETSEYASFLEMAADIARHHHERFDGTGYPDGLRGTQIPLAARIVTLADVFDALTSVRIYKDAVPPNVTRTIIEKERGRQFDPAVVDAFCACYDDFRAVMLASHSKIPPSLATVHACGTAR